MNLEKNLDQENWHGPVKLNELSLIHYPVCHHHVA